MTIGTGIDIIEIGRIEKAIKNNKFLTKCFTKNELEFIKSSPRLESQRAAGVFCAKEAVSKALGTGIVFKLTDIEIIKDELGKPTVLLYGKAKEISIALNIRNIQVSISHCKEYSVANCISYYIC